MGWHPMRPAQVIPSLSFAFASFVMHPASMLMMSRGASWWGTRWFPIVPAGAALLPLFTSLIRGGLWGATIGLLCTLPILAWMIAISMQAWQELATEPPASQTNPRLAKRWLLPTYLLVGLTICWLTLLVFAINMASSFARPLIWKPAPEANFALNLDTHEPGLLTYLQEYDANANNYSTKVLGGDTVVPGATVDAMRPLKSPDRWRRFTPLTPLPSTWYADDGFFTNAVGFQGVPLMLAYDLRGYLIGYEQYPTRRWATTIARDGIYPPGDLSGTPFVSDPLVGLSLFSTLNNAGFTAPLVDNQGVYLLGTNPLSISMLIDQRVDAISTVPFEKGHAPRMLVRSGDQVSEYQIVDADGSDTWYIEPDADPSDPVVQIQYSKLKSLTDLSLSAKKVHNYQIPASVGGPFPSVGLADGALYFAAYNQKESLYRIDAKGGLETNAFQARSLPTGRSNVDGFKSECVIAGLFPGSLGILFAGFATWDSLYGPMNGPSWQGLLELPIQVTTVVVSFLFVTMFALWLTRQVAYRRGLSRVQTQIWYGTVMLLGIAAPLSMAAIYRRVHRESCSHCERPRRVDTDTCEHCGQTCSTPAHDGIVMRDRVA